MPDNNPIKIDASPFMPVLIQIVTKLLTMLGAALAARGFVTEEQLAGAVPAVAQEVVGVLLAVGATLWAAWRSKRNNDQKIAIVTSPETYVPPAVAVVTDKAAPSAPLALVPFLFILLSAGGLSGCATAGDVRLNANKAFSTAQIAFHAVQQTALIVCTNPQPRLVQPCQKSLDVLKTGAEAEAAGFTAQQAGNAQDLQTAIITLTALPSQLAELGILEAN